jgi:cell division protein FtsL
VSAHAASTGWAGRGGAVAGPVRGVIARLRGRRSAREQALARRILLGAVLGLAGALGLVWIRLQVVHTGYDLSTARQLERKLEQQQRELELELTALTSPRRLEELARQRLGMGPPAPGQVMSPP